MKNNNDLKKKILYRSTHRGTKEMDLLLGTFAKKNINLFDELDLKDFYNLLKKEDHIIYDWYFNKGVNKLIDANKLTILLKKFKL